eukprot:CAMPEP_0171729864 /NCGR_PEP_ID=MMETSP0991-20121206/27907_1 /TAXON_ID=483369 /ORGANISM="non described non described, Strain CCMP2098" /LENGTH=76 /DNA_ID=CAMNT_0012324403 /DNA_START=196 /DNA_END=423 /DNA_ORIENTATION=+
MEVRRFWRAQQNRRTSIVDLRANCPASSSSTSSARSSSDSTPSSRSGSRAWPKRLAVNHAITFCSSSPSSTCSCRG